ncbi:MAG: OmpA family protein [Crocinitomicaceae bacterium]
MKNCFFTLSIFLATVLNVCYSQSTENILFGTGKSAITKVHSAKLNSLYKTNLSKATQITLLGHTDNVGDSLQNILLSSRRVESVKDYLIKLGYNPKKIDVKFHGENLPLNNNNTFEEQQTNRRVEIQWEESKLEIIEELKAIETDDIQDLYDLLAQKKQEFCINPNRDTILYLQQGTIISIPENAFQTDQEDCVLFRTKEIYKKSDMILENLNTMSGDKLLESGGMIYTEAVDDNGLNLSLNDGKELTIMMPTDTLLEGMRLFDGERDPHSNRINWETSSNSSVADIDFGDCLPYEYREKDSCNRCKILFCRLFGRIDETAKGMTDPEIRKLNKEFRKCQKIWRKTPEVFLPYSDYYDSTNCGQLMAEMGVNNWTELQDTLRAIRDQQMQILFEQYGVNNYDDYQDTLRAIRDQQMQRLYDQFGVNTYEEYQDTINKIAIRNQQLQSAKNTALSKGESHVKFINKNQKAALKTAFEYYKVDNFEDYQDTIRKLAEQEAKLSELKYYVANTNKLGWINCDRFSGYTRNQLTNMQVKLTTRPNTSCMAVFVDVKSVMQGYPNEHYYFNSIPRNLDIWIVALKYKNKQPYLYLEKTIVQDSIDNVTFRPLTGLELKNELKKLDN